ncbi:MAG: hypothetical protein IT226_10800 [Flavobacteriales bacterium]|nr:hypothetical protein [Flavobacteriales bacterium]
MGEKRYRTRSQWHNTRLVLYASPFLVLTGVFTGVATNDFRILAGLLVLLLVMLVVAVTRDRTTRGSYLITGETLILTRGGDRLVLPASDILDASQVDRAGARDYFNSRIVTREKGKDRIDLRKRYLRFCTVDIGLRTFTFGLGRGLTDRMPAAYQDMLLIRLREETDLLLSPEYNQDMMEAIARLIRRHNESASTEANRHQL